MKFCLFVCWRGDCKKKGRLDHGAVEAWPELSVESSQTEYQNQSFDRLQRLCFVLRCCAM